LARPPELLATALLERALLGVVVAPLAGDLKAEPGDLRPGAGIARVDRDAPLGRALELVEGVLRAAAASPAAGEADRVEQPARRVTADPEEHQAAAHEHGQDDVDRLDGAAAAAAIY